MRAEHRTTEGDPTDKAGSSGGRLTSRLPASHPPTETRWMGDLVFVAGVAGVLALLVLHSFPDVLRGGLIDTDSYMRLVRVRRLAESGAWFDNTIPRSNAPFGSTLHWTRPLDVLLLLGAWVTEPFLGFRRALHVSGALLSPLLLIAICFVTAWSVRPLAGRGVRRYALLAVLAQVGIMGYALPGRADHNMLILLAFVAMEGTAIRLLLETRSRWYGWATGAWAAFGLWISTEFLAPLFVLLLTLVVLWVAKGPEIAERARSVSLGLLTVTVAAVLLEHPPMDLLRAEYDRISVVHGFVAALVAAFWIPTASAKATRLGARSRGAYAAIGTMLAASLVLVAYPHFLGGPMADVNPELRRTWLPLLTEFQPYLFPHDLSGIGRILAYLGSALLAVGVAGHGMRRDRGTSLAGVWVLLGLGLALFIPLAIRWVRFAMYAEILGVIGTIFVLSRLLGRLDARLSGRRLEAVRALTTVPLLVGPILLGAGVMALGGESGGDLRKAASAQVDACPVEALVAALDDPADLGDHPHTILAHVDLGPLLLYRTNHSVVATPYHRNWQGILDWERIMSTRDPDQARRLVLARGIDLVVVCGVDTPAADTAAGGAPTFAALLHSGMIPGWLHPVDAAHASPGLRIYQVLPDSVGRAEG